MYVNIHVYMKFMYDMNIHYVRYSMFYTHTHKIYNG